MKRQIGQGIIFIFLFLLSYQFIENPYTNTYMNALREEQALTVSANDPLYVEIKQKVHMYEDKPVDAVIDPVWKAIPGYNGREVDIEKSFHKMKKDKRFNENKLVFKEKKPNISLSQLDPAPIYKGNPKKQMVAFQINVAWGNEYLVELLKILRTYDLQVTFNLDGSWTKKNPRLAKMIVDEGHEIGNHAYSHPDFQRLTDEQIREELEKTNDIIEVTVKRKPKWFAPPSGSYNTRAVRIAHELQMGTILWTIDTVDWKSPNPYDMASRVIQESHAGAMILMHPTQATVQGLEMIIEGTEKKGLQIGTVSELLSEKRTD